MDKISTMKKRDGFLNGHLLIAMPGMGDERFAHAVIYICAHSDEGAMGIMLNRRQDLKFPDLLLQLGIINAAQAIHLPEPIKLFPVRNGGPVDRSRGFVLPEPIKLFPVRNGGPVDRSRGFVLHTDDYACRTTIPVTRDICLTSTTDVLKAMSMGKGPERAIIALGYAGWAGGQLEAEIAANGWLTSPVDADFLFAQDFDHQYEKSLKKMGIDPTFLVGQAGHA